MCARLVLTGQLHELSHSDDTFHKVKEWFQERHPAIQRWPADHEWTIVELHLHDAWFINNFGGATVLDPETFEGIVLDLEPTSRPVRTDPTGSMGFLAVSMILSLMAGSLLGVFGSHWFHESVQYAKIVEMNHGNASPDSL